MKFLKLIQLSSIQSLQITCKSKPSAPFDKLWGLNGYDHLDMEETLLHIYDLLRDDNEKLVFELRFAHEMKPIEIARKHPGAFSSAKEVSIIIDRIRWRMRRNPVIKQLLDVLHF